MKMKFKRSQHQQRRKSFDQFTDGDQENEFLRKAAALAVLTEDESRAYHRKRKRQYFDTPPPTKKPKLSLTHLISLVSAGIKRKYSTIYSSIHSLLTGSSLPGIITFLVQMQVKLSKSFLKILA